MPPAPRIWEIVLTGGPCSGKTSALARLSEALEEHGKRVLVVPEVATTLIAGGLSDLPLMAAQPERFYAVERELVGLQRDLRARYRALAAALGTDTVILYDRAEMDAAAYLGAEPFGRLLAETGVGYAEVRDSYDLVVHLTSTAVDAPAHYTTANNQARTETAAQAAAMDRLTLSAWTGAHMTVIDNRTDFAGKLRRVQRAVMNAIGEPASLEVERKFLLAAAPDLTCEPLASAPVFHITQTYLRSEDPAVERRVRHRAHAGQDTYIHTVKRPSGADPAVREEVEERVSSREYRRLLTDADPDRRPIVKDRRVFIEHSHVFELDSFTGRDLHVLEVELQDADEPLTLPGCVSVAREVTSEPAFRNAALARA